MNKFVRVVLAVIIGVIAGFLSYFVMNIWVAATLGRVCLSNVSFCMAPPVDLFLWFINQFGLLWVVVWIVIGYKLLGRFNKFSY